MTSKQQEIFEQAMHELLREAFVYAQAKLEARWDNLTSLAELIVTNGTVSSKHFNKIKAAHFNSNKNKFTKIDFSQLVLSSKVDCSRFLTGEKRPSRSKQGRNE